MCGTVGTLPSLTLGGGKLFLHFVVAPVCLALWTMNIVLISATQCLVLTTVSF